MDSFFSSISDYWSVLVVIILSIIAIFTTTILKKITLPIIIGGHILMLSTLITLIISFVGFIALSFVTIYNRIFDLGNYITSSLSSLDCFVYFLSCLKVTSILSLFITELFSLLIVIVFIRLSFIFIVVMNLLSDKFWRLGVLIGLL